MNILNFFESNKIFSVGDSWLDKMDHEQNQSIVDIMRQIKDSIGGDHLIRAMQVFDYERIGSEFEPLNVDIKSNMYLCDRTDALCIHDMDGYPYMEEELDQLENLYFQYAGAFESLKCYEIYLLDSLGTYSKFELIVE